MKKIVILLFVVFAVASCDAEVEKSKPVPVAEPKVEVKQTEPVKEAPVFTEVLRSRIEVGRSDETWYEEFGEYSHSAIFYTTEETPDRIFLCDGEKLMVDSPDMVQGDEVCLANFSEGEVLYTTYVIMGTHNIYDTKTDKDGKTTETLSNTVPTVKAGKCVIATKGACKREKFVLSEADFNLKDATLLGDIDSDGNLEYKKEKQGDYYGYMVYEIEGTEHVIKAIYGEAH